MSKDTDIHSCSYFCERPACIKDQRDELRKDAERYRYLRNRNPKDVLQTTGAAAGCWIDCEDGEALTLLTGDDADAAIDAARGQP